MSSQSDRPTHPLAGHLLTAGRQEDRDAAPTDDSALFTLDQLVSSRAPTAARRGAFSSSEEDSGLIDLEALARNMPAPAAAPPPATMGAGSFPLGAPAPAAAPPIAAPEQPHPPRASRWVVYGLSGTAVLLAAALVFVLVRGTGQATTLATSASTTGASEASAASAAVPVAQVADPPGAGESDRERESERPGKPELAPAEAPPPSGPATPPAVRPTPIAAKPPASSPPAAPAKPGCPCPPDDLHCAIMCSE